MPRSIDPLLHNLEAVRERVRRAAGGGAPATLLAVTKSVSPALARRLVAAGQRDLGESRVDVLEAKVEALRDLAPRWHLIGHLQRNKARRAVRAADVIHSVDSLRLIGTLDRVAGEEGRRPEVYLEVRLAPESPDSERSGFAPEELAEAAAAAAAAPGLLLVGLMAIAPLPDPRAPDAARRTFEQLARLRDALPARLFAGGRGRLSMGMSSDLEDAVRAGSDVVRVGTALFEGVEDPEHSAPRRARA